MAVFRLTGGHPETQRRILYPDHEEGSACHGGTLVGGVASHLNHPLGGGMLGQTGETDAARFQMNEEQDVVGGETSPGEHFDGEEVGTCQAGHVGGDEILPGGILVRLGAGWIP
jgi:hypothetical protein